MTTGDSAKSAPAISAPRRPTPSSRASATTRSTEAGGDRERGRGQTEPGSGGPRSASVVRFGPRVTCGGRGVDIDDRHAGSVIRGLATTRTANLTNVRVVSYAPPERFAGRGSEGI